LGIGARGSGYAAFALDGLLFLLVCRILKQINARFFRHIHEFGAVRAIKK